jgi:peptidoglycan hydrolase-like protein with peptidoglycan-binding domain
VIRKRWVLVGAAVVVAATGGAVALSNANQAAPTAQVQPASTAQVERGALSDMVSVDGTLTDRARSDGSPYSVINQARGTYTTLPAVGDKVACGAELYRVDDKPVLLLCGTVPTYRGLQVGDVGNDVHQLNTNLHTLGYDAGAGVEIGPDDNEFTGRTEQALRKLQDSKGLPVTGALGIEDAIFLPESARIATVTGELGGPAQPGTPVLSATSDTLEVQVHLDASQQGEVHQGDRALITLPGNKSVTGKVDRLGAVAQAPAGQNGNAGVGAATIPAYISLDDPGKAGGLDQAPVQVDITTNGVQNVLSVPVTAIVGKSGGGFAVEVVRSGGRHELVAVKLGLFDTTAGRVQITGGIREGDHVVVPSA